MIVPKWLTASPRPPTQPLFIITERIWTKHPELIFLKNNVCHLSCLQHVVVGFVFAFLVSLISICYVFGIKLVGTALYLELRFPHDVTGIIVSHILGISVVNFFTIETNDVISILTSTLLHGIVRASFRRYFYCLLAKDLTVEKH